MIKIVVTKDKFECYRKKVGGKSSGTKAKPKFKSYAEARKDREKFRKKLVRAMERSVMLLVFCSVYNV